MGCGLVRTYFEFSVMRFMLGVAESGVFPATLGAAGPLVPASRAARANAFWNLCQPLAVAASAPITGWLLGAWGWRTALILEGALPFVWLPIWLYYVSDHPRDAKWISKKRRITSKKPWRAKPAELDTGDKAPVWQAFLLPAVFVMIPIYSSKTVPTMA